MATPDSNLGISASFDATQFRNAITFAMQMGTPPDTAKQAKFIKKSTDRTYWKNNIPVISPKLDRDGLPLDPTVEVRTSADTSISANCAIEIDRADADELPVGNFRATKAIVTFLDTDYALVVGCQEMIYNGDRYIYGYEPEGLGLFDVGVNTMIFYAVQES